MKLDPNLIEEFDRNGAVCLRGVFDQHWVDLVRSGIEKNLSSPSRFAEKLRGDRSDGHYFDDYCNWERIEEFREFALHSPAAAIAGILTRSKEISFYHEHVLVKEPGTDKETPWHHDQSYYPIDGDKVCSVWMPVDPVPLATCVRFVSGSHRWGWFQPRKFADARPYPLLGDAGADREYRPVPDVDGDPQFDILSWELQPGDCIVFHMKCLHGAPGNLSQTTPRRILSTRWLGDDAVIARRPWETSPPMNDAHLTFGERAVGAKFPIVWKSGQQDK